MVTFATAVVQSELNKQAEGSTGCYSNYTSCPLLATSLLLELTQNSQKENTLFLSYLSLDHFLQGVFTSP